MVQERSNKMRVLLKKIWDKGYLYNYVPIFPSDQWWNLWYLPFFALVVFLASLIPTPIWLTPAISARIVSVITIGFFVVSGLITLLFAYLMMTNPVTDGKLFPRTRIKKE